jgi:predicted lipoprotein with Yx(FWY)xxD motif
MKRIIMLSALTGVLALTGCSTLKNVVGIDKSGTHEVQATSNNTAPVASKNGMLVDSANNMTLYTFDKDSMNKSECVGDCLKAWPALTAPSNVKTSGQFSTIQRDDGSYQWAANDKPLYFFVKDMKVGDMNGDKVGGVWHIVKTK